VAWRKKSIKNKKPIMGLLDRHIWKRMWVAQATTCGGLFVYHKNY
jgi:hypothetical protein